MRHVFILIACLACLPVSWSAQALLGVVEGHARHPMLHDNPAAGFVELYENNVWLSPQGTGEVHTRRTGAPYFAQVRHDGFYTITALPGRYSLYMHQGEWYPRPALVANVELRAGETLNLDIQPALDYAVAFGTNADSWTPGGELEAWDWARDWMQTFVATGTSITHLGFKLAGSNSETALVTLHEDNGDPDPANWPAVGQSRNARDTGAMRDVTLFWRSGELPTSPGTRYAMRVRADAPIGFWVHRDVIAQAYAQGTAHKDGVAQPYDLYMVIGGDSDGTLLPYMKRVEHKPGMMAGWAQRWGQTWVAMGHGLAAVDLFATDGTGMFPARLTVRRDGPGGEPVGPAKVARAGWWGPGSGILGASFNPGEVPLTPGETYYLEFAAHEPAEGFHANRFVREEDRYPHGMAFMDGEAQPDVDLELTIMEYAAPGAPLASDPALPDPPTENLLANGDFEQGEQAAQGPDVEGVEGWTAWRAAPTAFWYGPNYGREQSRGLRLIGGAINDTSIDGGVTQRVDGLASRQNYRFSGWVRASHLAGAGHWTLVGVDPTGQTSDPRASTIQWQPLARTSHTWEHFALEPVRPESESISVWLRAANPWKHETFHADFDDLALTPAR